MSSKERRTLREMIEEANAAIRAVTAEEAIDLSQRDDHLLIDLRDIRELARDGRIEGAFHCPRGMLEFWLELGESLLQGGVLGSRKKLRFLLRRRYALRLGHQVRAGHGLGAGDAYRRRLRRVGGVGRAGASRGPLNAGTRGTRLFRRARHLDHCQVAPGGARGGSHHLHCGSGAERGPVLGAGARAADRDPSREHPYPGCARGVCAGLRVSDVSRQCALRRLLPARHGDRAAADCVASRGYRAQDGSRCDFAWRHRKGQ